MATKPGHGSYQENTAKAYEKGTRVAGLSVLRSGVEASGYTFQIRFNRDLAMPQNPESVPGPKGWFTTHRANRYHYDSGMQKSLCGRVLADETTTYNTALNSSLNCRKCRFRYDNQ